MRRALYTGTITKASTRHVNDWSITKIVLRETVTSALLPAFLSHKEPVLEEQLLGQEAHLLEERVSKKEYEKYRTTLQMLTGPLRGTAYQTTCVVQRPRERPDEQAPIVPVY